MRGRLYWIVLGGASFWIAPIAPIVLATVLDPALMFGHRFSPYVSIISIPIPTGMILPIVLSLPVVGIVSFCAVSWITSGHEPVRAEWILVGIYSLGFVFLLAASVIVHVGPYSPNVLKDIALRMLYWLIQAIPALLIVNIILSAMGLRFSSGETSQIR